ncbi:arginase family protein [Penicillium solitum]|uniref:arginase family protein n=1 Tax=Penicillium solitum TaxID=60172 RepID=UPI00183A2A79|nr:hypothetical protein HAV15_003222 [Penicillium sp. str. \
MSLPSRISVIASEPTTRYIFELISIPWILLSLRSLVPLRLDRELRTIICGLDGLNLIGVDIIEVAPTYDTNAELSTMYMLSLSCFVYAFQKLGRTGRLILLCRAVAHALYEVLIIMAEKGALSIVEKSCICR